MPQARANPRPPEPGKRGNKGRYQPYFATLARQHYRAGATDEEVAQLLGVAKQTVYEWQKKYPEFLAAKTEKLVADIEVVHGLYARAVGLPTEDVTETLNRETGELEVTKVVKGNLPPNPTAARVWLNNRRPESWRESMTIDVGGDVISALAEGRERANKTKDKRGD